MPWNQTTTNQATPPKLVTQRATVHLISRLIYCLSPTNYLDSEVTEFASKSSISSNIFFLITAYVITKNFPVFRNY